MITAISQSKETNLIANSIKQNKNKRIYNNRSVLSDSNIASELKPIYFKGNLTKIGKNILGESCSRLGEKITRIAEETAVSTKETLRKLKSNKELSTTEKPMCLFGQNVANMMRDMWQKIDEAKKLLDNGKLTPSEYDAKVKAIHAYYDPIIAANPPSSITSGDVRKDQPKPIKHHDDFNDNSDNLNSHNGLNHNGQTSFGGEGNNLEQISMDDYIANSHNASLTDNVSDHVNKASEFLGNKSDISQVISDNHGLGADALSHGTDILESASETIGHSSTVLDALSDVAEKLDNPLILGTAAELLPFTKALTPLNHLKNGDIDKALVTGATRAVEVLVAKVKLGVVVIGGGLGGGISRLLGNKGKGTGVIGGINAASKRWAEGREYVENGILGVEKESELARGDRLRKIDDKQTELAINKAKIEANQESTKRNAVHNSEMETSKNDEFAAKELFQNASQETVFYNNQSKTVKGQMKTEKDLLNQKIEQLNVEQIELRKGHEAIVETLSKKIADAKMQNNKELQGQLKIELEEMLKTQKLEMQEATKHVTTAVQAMDVFAKIADKSNVKGFGKIAGYEEQIEILLDDFGGPIALEKTGKDVDVPGAILFFGPKGNGKTTFAKAFAGQLDCKIVPIDSSLDALKDFSKLKNIAKDAKKRFKTDRTRTIIMINELDVFAPKESKVFDWFLKRFIDNCSKKYHCTIFATTNHPENVDTALLSDKRFYKAGLAPANKKNAIAILKHYAEGFADENINYNELAEQIVKVQPNNAFSNDKIRSIVTTLTELRENRLKKITQKDLAQAISQNGPDINKSALDHFSRQLDFFKNISKNETKNFTDISNVPLVSEESKAEKIAFIQKEPLPESSLNPKPIKEPGVVKEISSVDVALNRGYDLYAEKLAKDPEFQDKKGIIREVTPELLSIPKTIIKDDNDKKVILKFVTSENKDFIFKEAIPTILRNFETLGINNVGDVKSLLEIVTPGTIDCLDKLAENAKLFKIQSNIDTFNILRTITKENKDFVLSHILPELASNADKYRINRGGYMAGFIETITPENKDFMFNEAIPMIIKNSEKLELDSSEIPEILKRVNQDNLKNIQIMADNINQFDIKDELGFLDFDKLDSYFKK